MGFKWVCECGQVNFYKGEKEFDANSTCSNCKKTQRIWRLRVLKLPTNSNKIQQKSLEFPTEYKTILRASKSTAEINLNPILKCMERGISTIENKPEVKKKKGAYYWDFVAWTEQFEILKKLKEEVEK